MALTTRGPSPSPLVFCPVSCKWAAVTSLGFVRTIESNDATMCPASAIWWVLGVSLWNGMQPALLEVPDLHILNNKAFRGNASAGGFRLCTTPDHCWEYGRKITVRETACFNASLCGEASRIFRSDSKRCFLHTKQGENARWTGRLQKRDNSLPRCLARQLRTVWTYWQASFTRCSWVCRVTLFTYSQGTPERQVLKIYECSSKRYLCKFRALASRGQLVRLKCLARYSSGMPGTINWAVQQGTVSDHKFPTKKKEEENSATIFRLVKVHDNFSLGWLSACTNDQNMDQSKQ